MSLPINISEQLKELTLRPENKDKLFWTISERPAEARAVWPATVEVDTWRNGQRLITDKDAHWMHRGSMHRRSKGFTKVHVPRDDDQWKRDSKKSWAATREVAIAWATERFGPQELKKSKFRSWVPVDCIDIPTDRQRFIAEKLPQPCRVCGVTITTLNKHVEYDIRSGLAMHLDCIKEGRV